MSIQALIKNPANATICPNQYDLKCNSLDACSNITVPNINVNTINNVAPVALQPGLTNQFLKSNLGNIQWEYFQLGSMSQALGTADSVLVTNNTATQAAWSKDLVLDSVNILDQDGIKLNSVAPAANQSLASDGLGNLTWRPYGEVLPGANNTVYITDSLGVQGFSNNVVTDSVTVTNQFISTNDTNLDNVNIVSSLDIAGISPLAGQVVGTDNMNQLGWQSLPLQQKYSIYHCTASLNINFGVNTTLTYVPGYNDLVGSIDQITPSNFICNTAGTYLIRADISCLASTSENECQIYVSSLGPVAYSFINLASSFASMSAIVNLVATDIIQILSVRTNLDPTPKLNLANSLSSPVMFCRIA